MGSLQFGNEWYSASFRLVYSQYTAVSMRTTYTWRMLDVYWPKSYVYQPKSSRISIVYCRIFALNQLYTSRILAKQIPAVYQTSSCISAVDQPSTHSLNINLCQPYASRMCSYNFAWSEGFPSTDEQEQKHTQYRLTIPISVGASVLNHSNNFVDQCILRQTS